MYLTSIPWIIKKIYADCIWDIKSNEKILYFTFDDGPHEIATPFVLDLLKSHNAKATFFCIGNNVTKYPELFQRIQNEGHAVGNHTFNHLNGKKTEDNVFIKDIYKAKKVIPGNLFRPPYGRITKFQLKLMNEAGLNLKTIMWSVLSGDFDLNISPAKCLSNVIQNCKKGSIVVFHDSSKAFTRLEFALPRALEYFSSKGFIFNSIKIEHDSN